MSDFAKAIAADLCSGYLSTDRSSPCVLMGYSYGAFMALEICRALQRVHSYRVAGFVPVCMSAPQRFSADSTLKEAVYALLPKAVR